MDSQPMQIAVIGGTDDSRDALVEVLVQATDDVWLNGAILGRRDTSLYWRRRADDVTRYHPASCLRARIEHGRVDGVVLLSRGGVPNPGCVVPDDIPLLCVAEVNDEGSTDEDWRKIAQGVLEWLAECYHDEGDDNG